MPPRSHRIRLAEEKEFVGFASVATGHGESYGHVYGLGQFVLLAHSMKKFRFAFIFIEFFSSK